jgi:hypothetical protein
MGMSAVEADRMRAQAAEAEPHLVTEPVEWNRKLAAHHDRLTAALRWFIAGGDATAAVEMVANLRRYWFDERHNAEARDLSAAAVAMDAAPSAARYAEAMMGWARFTFFTGRPAGDAYALALAAARAQADTASESSASAAWPALRCGRAGGTTCAAMPGRRCNVPGPPETDHSSGSRSNARRGGTDDRRRRGGQTPLRREHRDRGGDGDGVARPG